MHVKFSPPPPVFTIDHRYSRHYIYILTGRAQILKLERVVRLRDHMTSADHALLEAVQLTLLLVHPFNPCIRLICANGQAPRSPPCGVGVLCWRGVLLSLPEGLPPRKGPRPSEGCSPQDAFYSVQ